MPAADERVPRIPRAAWLKKLLSCNAASLLLKDFSSAKFSGCSFEPYNISKFYHTLHEEPIHVLDVPLVTVLTNNTPQQQFHVEPVPNNPCLSPLLFQSPLLSPCLLDAVR